MKKDTPAEWGRILPAGFPKHQKLPDEATSSDGSDFGKAASLIHAAQEKSLGALLAQNDDQGKERPLYYLSHYNGGAEVNYSPIEKGVPCTHLRHPKLRHYLLAHSTNLISRADPLKFIMSRPMLFGWLAKWALLLSEFEINFIPQKAIKGQGLANFLADHPIPAEWEVSQSLPDEEVFFVEVLPPWRMYFDGAARKNGAGAGVLFISPNEDLMPYSFILSHCCTNNEAEYQAIILGLGMAIEMGLSQLEIFGDSALVIKQIIGDFEVRKDELMPYQKEAQRLLQKISNVTLGHVPRASNSQSGRIGRDRCKSGTVRGKARTNPYMRKMGGAYPEKFSRRKKKSIWFRSAAYKEIKAATVVDFIGTQIVYRYGVPRYIMTDNGTRSVTRPWIISVRNSASDEGAPRIQPCRQWLGRSLQQNLVQNLKEDGREGIRKIGTKGSEKLVGIQDYVRAPGRINPIFTSLRRGSCPPTGNSNSIALRVALREGLTEEENIQLRLQELESLDEAIRSTAKA
ncbi:hypothetical protein H6P81_002859 [Aristolochia fimbriata]|uniref:RNase H type-1 domain-containing protein n=1 Tax=Aristolochia fimbriata TaxID=158543 RepID=A0AAV7FE47_ARIFI|nr:hypothetical protein H6P81_002859 [Aristolochia fimbriata]